MGLFKEVQCANCGEKASILTRRKLSDGNYVCGKCIDGIPSYILPDIARVYDISDFENLKKYLSYSQQQLKTMFVETLHFTKVHIDEVHRLFYIENGLFEEPLYLQFENIHSFDLDFKAAEFKEGFLLGGQVVGEITLAIQMCVPEFSYFKVVAKDVKVKAKSNFLGTQITYDYPKKMEVFMVRFMSAWNDALEECEASPQETFANGMSELEKAKVLFMLDDIENLTIEDVKEQRNKLIQMFHPDIGNAEDTKYAQKINRAYEILKEHLM